MTGLPPALLPPTTADPPGTGRERHRSLPRRIRRDGRPKARARRVGGSAVPTAECSRLTGGWLLAKELVDRLGATVLLLVLAPVMLAVAVAVWTTSPGPIVFCQRRVGRDGRTFCFFKFRTMVADADSRLPGLQDRNSSDGLLFKVPDDPRVTSVGRFLRRWSLDELPQLWNVLRGDMSLVGPRPLPVEPDEFRGPERRRLRVKPGITGLWQVSGRSQLGWQETVRLDAHYVDHWSLTLDLSILLRTPAAVLRGRGAY
jgi:lipopolysaccharide/colanic/teichoic acid biosynthesis glycosyltransferase